MTEYTQNLENNWRQTVSDFRAYLQQTVAALPFQQEAGTDDEPVSTKARKARSHKQTQVISGIQYQSQFVYLLPVGEQRRVSVPSTARRYSSPLWVMIGDDDSRQKRKAK